MNSTITAINGIKVGHYTDEMAKTGCTAVMCESGAVAGVDVRGSAPGTRETDLLRGFNVVERVQCIMLSGGSAYGLDAASGAMQYLEEHGLGLDVGVCNVPIVPAAVIFDLGVGDAHVRPGKAEGYAACTSADDSPVQTGNVGAGTGATVGKSFGQEFAGNGGVGSACVVLDNGVKVAAIAVVNAFGDVYDPDTGNVVACAEVNGIKQPIAGFELASKGFGNTTIGVVATDACINREQANKLAAMAHDGLALTIRPVHTSLDGDTFFAISTCEAECTDMLLLQMAAVKAVSLAVMSAVGFDKQLRTE